MAERAPVSRDADRDSEADRSTRIEAAFEREAQALLRRAFFGRLLALVGVGGWILATFAARGDLTGAFYYLTLLIGFLAIGALQPMLRLRGRGRWWHKYAFITADIALLAYTLTVPPLWGGSTTAPLAVLGGTAFIFFLLIIVGTALSNTPQLVLWAGFSIVVAWSAAVLWPGAQSPWQTGLIDGPALAAQVIVAAVTSCLNAFAVFRARSVAQRQAVVEFERANLARYFSPNMVDQLAASDAALRAVSAQNVAVLFTDIVGFTAMAAAMTPEAVVALLREHFARLEQVVFRHGGTLDKYLGDGLMATFGTPRAGADDATRALDCGRDLIAAVALWNRERRAAGLGPLRIGVGIHYGPVVMGNIGGARRLEFTVIGDTVNIASRIEAMTRDLDCDLLISAAVVEAVRTENAGTGALEGLSDLGAHALRGRDGKVGLWGLRP